MLGDDDMTQSPPSDRLRREVEALVRRYEALGTELFADRVWPCDVGVVALRLLGRAAH